MSVPPSAPHCRRSRQTGTASRWTWCETAGKRTCKRFRTVCLQLAFEVRMSACLWCNWMPVSARRESRWTRARTLWAGSWWGNCAHCKTCCRVSCTAEGSCFSRNTGRNTGNFCERAKKVAFERSSVFLHVVLCSLGPLTLQRGKWSAPRIGKINCFVWFQWRWDIYIS